MVLKKNTLKYRFFQVLAYLGDTGLEFLANEVAKGKRVYLGRRKYSSRHFYRVFEELTTTGYIERVIKNNKAHLQLTSIAKSAIANNIPLPVLQNTKWDGYFRGLAYDFPEGIGYKRDALREKIKTWGLGKFQRSLWITPHQIEDPIDDFIKSNNISSYVQTFMTRKLAVKKGKEISEKTWKITDLQHSYLDFAIKWLRKIQDKELEPQDLETVRFEYFFLLENDPHLPFELLPPDWGAGEAKEIFLAVEESLNKK